MSKYSSEFKLEVVNYYLSNYTSYNDVAKYFDISSSTSIKKWVSKYKKHGGKGLLKNFHTSYDGTFKQNVVEYMHTNHLSYNETANHFNLGCDKIVKDWECIYYEKGPQGFYKEEQCGSKKTMKSDKKKNKNTNKEDLVAEVERLRMENAYLKKLQALVQERTKPKHPRK